jgi:hypothetical protein
LRDKNLAQKIEAIEDPAYKASMYKLMELGFKDYEKCINAL